MRRLILLVLLLWSPALGAQDYPWMGDVEQVPTQPLDARFAVPEGFTRVPAAAGSYQSWLRGLPVRTDRTAVMTYRGEPIGSPSAGIVLLDLGTRNLQQCADSAIRLHAEYHWQRGEADRLGYHFTSGDLSTWKAWRRGERFVVKGAKVKRVRSRARKADHAEFRSYLDHVFRYAGTKSLWRDSDEVKSSIEGGDFFVQGGAPGHAVVVLDVATDGKGRRIALIGQGFLPAQDFHVVRDPGAPTIGGVWFLLPDQGQLLHTPSWNPFARNQARRFRLR